jgi:hypothetical protein
LSAIGTGAGHRWRDVRLLLATRARTPAADASGQPGHSDSQSRAAIPSPEAPGPGVSVRTFAERIALLDDEQRGILALTARGFRRVDIAAALHLSESRIGVRRAALERAGEVLAPLLDVDAYAGAANMLLAEVLEEQRAGLDERIRLLEASVAREPDWVSNRQDLAWAYSESGRHSEAAEQLERAIGSVRSADPRVDAGPRQL